MSASPGLTQKYRGKDEGSIWFWDELKEEWRKIARSFVAFTSMLYQEPESDQIAELRDVIQRDDVSAMQQYLASQPPSKLDEADSSTGHSLLQRAADAGAVKVVALLIDCGARGIVGLGNVNVRRHAKVIELLLTRARYLPTKYDWQGAAAFGGPVVLRLYFKHAPTPPRSLLQQLVKNSKNLMKSKRSKERDVIIRILEDELASPINKRGSVRKLIIGPVRKS